MYLAHQRTCMVRLVSAVQLHQRASLRQEKQLAGALRVYGMTQKLVSVIVIVIVIV